ncbi:hypothetical protein DOM21_16520 [Bacteriovorax stolpii]|nr:hypothetical protein DOM21_16520 [Bacteriovorax stolpii]
MPLEERGELTIHSSLMDLAEMVETDAFVSMMLMVSSLLPIQLLYHQLLIALPLLQHRFHQEHRESRDNTVVLFLVRKSHWTNPNLLLSLICWLVF